jgi:hypothetical protein
LSPIYKGLSQQEKETVRKRVRDFFVDQTNAKKEEDDRNKAEAKRAANALELELLNPATTMDRQRQIINILVSSEQMTLAAAKSWLDPKDPKGDVRTELMLLDEIRAGNMQTMAGVLVYADKLSDTQLRTVGNYLRNESYRAAEDKLKSEAGIVGFELNPTEAKIKKLMSLKSFFNYWIEKGSLPRDAADAAVKAYNEDKNVQAYEARKAGITKRVREALANKGFSMPNVAIEDIRLESLRNARGQPLDDGNRNAIQTMLNELGPLP